jgi:hypothetical protein
MLNHPAAISSGSAVG